MIVVVGSVAYRPESGGEGDAVTGRAAAIARAAAGQAEVQLVAKVGDDGAGDAIVVALGREGVGHAALLRDPGHPTPIAAGAGPDEDAASPTSSLIENDSATAPPAALLPSDPSARPTLEPEDVELALRYLPQARVVVVAEPVEAAVAVAIAAGAGFASTEVVAVVTSATGTPDALSTATVFAAPEDDPDEAFARVVASYAVALDAGREPREAFAAAVSGGGWEPAPAD